MANGISRGLIATSTVLVLLVLLQATLVWHQSEAAPAKRNDILAGTEFLSVFINGAMAPTPQRRRGLRRGRHPATDHAAAETRQQEASIYRISRAKPTVIDSKVYGASGDDDENAAQVLPREDGAKFYPISQKNLESRDNLASLIDDLGTVGVAELKPDGNKTDEQRSSNGVNQKVIGVSVTSTVEATPYKVRVEHYDSDNEATTVTRPPTTDSSTERPRVSGVTTPIATTVATSARSVDATRIASTTPLPARLVTEELSNIVSESNRSEFSVDEGSPRTSWRGRVRPVPATPSSPSASSSFRGHYRKEAHQKVDGEEAEPVEENFEVPEPREMHEEMAEIVDQSHQARKSGRHYEAPSLYNQPSKVYAQPAKVYSKPSRVYSEPAKVYSEPAKIYSEPERVYSEPAKIYSEPSKIYSEPSRVYSEPAKIYSEPAKIYSEPEKVYSEPAKIYSEPSKIYSEPAKVYSEPAKVYSEPAKVYGSDGRPVAPPASQRDALREPEEENYEVDEAVSVESNGKVHGPQSVTESPPSGAASSSSSDAEDGHKVGYVVEGRNYRKYRVEERTPDGFIVGEYGVVSHDDGSLRGVRYTADGTINPRLIYDALMKFLAL